jgi:hypothetical protein
MTEKQRIVAFWFLLILAVVVHFSFVEWVEMGSGDWAIFKARVGEVSVPYGYGTFSGSRSVPDKGRVPVYLACGLGIPALLIGIGAFIRVGGNRTT